MKKLMMIAAMVLMSTGAFAQEAGMKAVGATFSDYLDSDSRIAIGAKFQYSFTENMRGEFDFKLYPPKWHSILWNPTVNFHYLFPIIDKLYVYPLAGVGVLGYYNSDTEYSSTIFTVKFGSGAEYYITEKFKGIFETYYQVAKKDNLKYSDPIISIGAGYIF